MKWSTQQAKAIDDVAAWHKRGGELYRLMGYAGTGKTTLAKHLASSIDGDTVFCAFTGKAALVMRKNGCTDARTIHSLIYKTTVCKRTGMMSFTLNDESDAATAKLIVVDECSMVNEEIGLDLLSFGVPVLVLGDPEQLPPIKGAGYFVNGTADTMLTEIHRQAADNPIIRLATMVREGEKLELGDYGAARVITRNDVTPKDILQADQVLVGMNRTRESYNRRLRQLKGFEHQFPVKGDRIVCLKNDHDKGIFNGGLFEVTEDSSMRKHVVEMTLKSEDFGSGRQIDVICRKECFTGGLEALDWKKRKGHQEMTYGYALTVHKSQGSQFEDVFLFDESFAFNRELGMPKRWLYTGITRAAERQTIVVNA